MKKKFRFAFEKANDEKQIESYSHMEFVAYILIDDRIINYESVSLFNNDLSRYSKEVDKLKSKYCDMYQELLDYRKKNKLETMRVSLEYKTLHSVDNLPF